MRRAGHDVAICYRQTAQARAAGAPPHWTSYALCWNELATADPGRAKSFFGALLCWQYQAGGSGSVTIIHAGRRNGSIRAQTGQEQGMPRAWGPYFTVGNAEDAARHAGQAGGRTVVPPTGTRTGRIAVIADPQGATFTVYEGLTDPSGVQTPRSVHYKQARKECK